LGINKLDGGAMNWRDALDVLWPALLGYSAVFWFWVFIGGGLTDWPLWTVAWLSGLLLIVTIAWLVLRRQASDKD
jgi:hypothetical protein